MRCDIEKVMFAQGRDQIQTGRDGMARKREGTSIAALRYVGGCFFLNRAFELHPITTTPICKPSTQSKLIARCTAY